MRHGTGGENGREGANEARLRRTGPASWTAVGLALLLLSSCTYTNRLVPIERPPGGVSGAGLGLPVEGKISSPFSLNRTIRGVTRPHKGIDVAGGTWLMTPIFAAADGTVTRSEESESYGEVIYILHPNGWITRYAHMSWRHAWEGMEVKRGDLIGRLGDSGHSFGTHLHFEILRGGRQVNPEPLLPKLTVGGGARGGR